MSACVSSAIGLAKILASAKWGWLSPTGCENTLEIRRYYVLYVLIFIMYNTQGYYAKDTLVVYSYSLQIPFPVYARTPLQSDMAGSGWQ